MYLFGLDNKEEDTGHSDEENESDTDFGKPKIILEMSACSAKFTDHEKIGDGGDGHDPE